MAAHIIPFSSPDGVTAVVNGIALCAIHHLAYDRNLMGIDPGGVVHIGERLLAEDDGPMLTSGLQGFHGASILQPRRTDQRPDPERLALRFAEFEAAA
jgi:putative restriction endonuclease